MSSRGIFGGVAAHISRYGSAWLCLELYTGIGIQVRGGRVLRQHTLDS